VPMCCGLFVTVECARSRLCWRQWFRHLIKEDVPRAARGGENAGSGHVVGSNCYERVRVVGTCVEVTSQDVLHDIHCTLRFQ
jgi:hypothetical protein